MPAKAGIQIPARPRDAPAASSTPRGVERSEAEYRALMERSGFALQRTVAIRSPFSVLEAVPA